MSILSRLSDRSGATVVEFALVAPVFLVSLLGAMEGARLLWMRQALGEAAYSTARCRMIGAATCSDAARQVAYAVRRARGNGVAVGASDVTIVNNATCGTSTGAVRVTIRTRFTSPIADMLPLAETVEGAACLPKLGP